MFFFLRLPRPNPLQYFLVPDVEIENGGDDDEDDLEDEEEVRSKTKTLKTTHAQLIFFSIDFRWSC